MGIFLLKLPYSLSPPALPGSGTMGIISARNIKAPLTIKIMEILKDYGLHFPASALPASGTMGIISACTGTPE